MHSSTTLNNEHNISSKIDTVLKHCYTLCMTIQHREIIAYQGSCFTIEWYYNEKGISEAYNYYSQLPPQRRRKVLALFKHMGEMGKIFDKTKFRYEGDQVYTFKPQPDRFLCFFFTSKKIIITNAFEKKTNKLPKHEKEKALISRAKYKQRIIEGTYYESL